ncbi:hypothetical protein BJ166DRAFT_501286 [Pestalotiopsis sp. NC0098]|nr:hypothetical protein BJ166DRAFT_501286 [Pestalotiopsis sp. NC0098]
MEVTLVRQVSPCPPTHHKETLFSCHLPAEPFPAPAIKRELQKSESAQSFPSSSPHYPASRARGFGGLCWCALSAWLQNFFQPSPPTSHLPPPPTLSDETQHNTGRAQQQFHQQFTEFRVHSDNDKFEKHVFRFQDAKHHEDRDRKDEAGHPLVGTIEVRAYHLHKSVVVPAVTGGEGEGMSLNQYDDPLKGRSVGSVDLDEIDEYSKRAVDL